MTTKFLKSCAALTLLGVGGAAIPTNVLADPISVHHAGRSAVAFARGPSTQHPQILRPDSLIKTSKAGGILLTERGLARGVSAIDGHKDAPSTAFRANVGKVSR